MRLKLPRYVKCQLANEVLY